MGFHITHRTGAMEAASLSALPMLLGELDAEPLESEHASVSVTHDSEWCLSVRRGGYVVFENLEEGEPRHMEGVSPERVLSYWQRLTEGDFDALEREPWKPGY